MNLFYNVGMSAESEPRLAYVEYRGDKSKKDFDYVFLGKGLTYDTGGLNLKPSAAIMDMYMDKGGAAAVYGAMLGALRTDIKKNVVFAFGLAENAIDSKSYKPDDIITSMKGLTVEIGNTDAEGRLVLADSMTFLQREYKPQELVELSTLTGAILVALGNQTAGLFSNDKKLAEGLIENGKEVDEAYWQMPIPDDIKESMKCASADVNSAPGRGYGGSSQAAHFLELFVEGDTKWAHLDIAGPAMQKAATHPYGAKGTAFGAQTLLRYLSK